MWGTVAWLRGLPASNSRLTRGHSRLTREQTELDECRAEAAIKGDCQMRTREWSKRAVLCVPVILAAGLSGCKTLNERYIQLEVWKYQKCFGHLPPGFVPPGAAAGAASRPCGQGAPMQGAPCQPAGQGAPCQSASFSPNVHQLGNNCDECQGATVDGAMPGGAGGTIVPGGGTIVPGSMVPAGPGGSPGPMPNARMPTPAGMTTSRPVIISDEVVLP